MTEPLITVEKFIDADPEAVWAALTQKKSAMFLGADVDTDWRPGSQIRFSGEFKGRSFRDHGEIRLSDPRRHLAFTHFSESSGKPDISRNYNLIDIRLEPHGDRTKVTLSQTPQSEHHLDDKTIGEFRKNWDMMLDGLKKAAEEKALAAT